jgi:hypothetical protein
MPTNPTSGAIAVFKIGTSTIPGMDWKLSVDSKIKDVANFKDGRRQKGTLPDADFTSKILWDADSPPHDPAGPNLVEGAEITALLYVTLTKFYSVPIVISKIDISSEIEGVVMYDISGKQNGPIVRPLLT